MTRFYFFLSPVVSACSAAGGRDENRWVCTRFASPPREAHPVPRPPYVTPRLVASKNLAVVCSPYLSGTLWPTQQNAHLAALGLRENVFCVIISTSPGRMEESGRYWIYPRSHAGPFAGRTESHLGLLGSVPFYRGDTCSPSTGSLCARGCAGKSSRETVMPSTRVLIF